MPGLRGAVEGRLDARARAVAGAAISCLEAAQELWAEHPGSSLLELLDEAMAAIAHVG